MAQPEGRLQKFCDKEALQLMGRTCTRRFEAQFWWLLSLLVIRKYMAVPRAEISWVISAVVM